MGIYWHTRPRHAVGVLRGTDKLCSELASLRLAQLSQERAPGADSPISKMSQLVNEAGGPTYKLLSLDQIRYSVSQGIGRNISFLVCFAPYFPPSAHSGYCSCYCRWCLLSSSAFAQDDCKQLCQSVFTLYEGDGT